MIYLIGGAPGSGKSFLAAQLEKKLKARVLELDLLMPAFNKFISADDYSLKLPVWQAKKTGKEPSFYDYRVEAETYWPAISAMLNSFINHRDNENLIVEGAQLNPRLVSKWLSSMGAGQGGEVKVLFLSHQTTSLGREFDKDLEATGFNAINRDEATAQF
jgi:2-phosphoglycerate kinase